MNKKVHTTLLIVLLTYINGPFFFIVITPLHRCFYYAISVLPFFIAVYKGVKKNINVKHFSLITLIYVLSIFLVQLVTNAFDFQFLIAFTRSVLNILGTLSIFSFYQYSNEKIDMSYREISIISVILYISGSIVFLCVPSLKAFWTSIIVQFNAIEFMSVIEYVTRFGFAGFSGFGFTYWVSSCTIVFCYMYINKELEESKSYIYIIMLLIGSFFYGRSGFVVTSLFFILLTLYSLFNKKRKLLKFFVFILLFFIVIGFVLYFSVPFFKPFIDWLLEPFFSYLEGGKFESASTNGLKKFYENFHPSDKTFLLGDGYWMDLNGKGYYGHTDVGFMRNIYYGGIFYTLIQYTLVISVILYVGLWIKNNHKKGVFFIPLLMFLDFLLFELKGDIVFLWLKQFLPFYLSLLYSGKSEVFLYRKLI